NDQRAPDSEVHTSNPARSSAAAFATTIFNVSVGTSRCPLHGSRMSNPYAKQSEQQDGQEVGDIAWISASYSIARFFTSVESVQVVLRFQKENVIYARKEMQRCND